MCEFLSPTFRVRLTPFPDFFKGFVEESDRCYDLKALETAWHECDGSKFAQIITATNQRILLLQDAARFLRYRAREACLPLPLALTILEQAYQRTVVPKMALVKRAKVGVSQEYGELGTDLVDDIIVATQLTRSQVFLDIGSGVGSVAAQVSLQTGCTSIGIELLDTRAAVAQPFLRELQRRCATWGVRVPEVTLRQGDVTQDGVGEDDIKRANVILVNNEKFEVKCKYFP